MNRQHLSFNLGTNRFLALLGTGLCFCTFALLGCSDDSSEGAGIGDDEQSDIELGLSGDGDTGGQDGAKGRKEDGSCAGLKAGEGCLGEVYEGESVPLDLYMMFDQSGSMSTVVDEGTGAQRIDVVRSAVRSFLKDDESIGMRAGIGYFGNQPLKETTCDPADYADPDVEMGVLPDREEALLASLDSKMPTGETPTGAAIRGACDYVGKYRAEHRGRNPFILLVTDGEPKAPLSRDQCAPTLEDAVDAAKECFEEEGIRIYVLGVGPSLSNLRVIAEAGGTETAFLADLDNAEQVLEAFRAVRYAAQLPCELMLSREALSDEEADLDAATVAYLDFECSYQEVSEVADEASCGDGAGWYFDDPDAPTRIHLCETTCGTVKSTGRQLYYSLGCPLEVEVVR